MSPEQKSSTFTLAICITAGVAYAALVPFVGADRAMGALGILGFLGLQPLFFRKPRDSDHAVVMDERDRSIARRAATTAGACSYLALVLTCMGLWFFYESQGKATITIHALPAIVAIGAVALFVSRSVAILFLYRVNSAHE